MLKKHLLEGVKKGAFDEAEAEKRFEAWKASKESKLNKTIKQIEAKKVAVRKYEVGDQGQMDLKEVIKAIE